MYTKIATDCLFHKDKQPFMRAICPCAVDRIVQNSDLLIYSYATVYLATFAMICAADADKIIKHTDQDKNLKPIPE